MLSDNVHPHAYDRSLMGIIIPILNVSILNGYSPPLKFLFINQTILRTMVYYLVGMGKFWVSKRNLLHNLSFKKCNEILVKLHQSMEE